jgi:hypothetical protein
MKIFSSMSTTGIGGTRNALDLARGIHGALRVRTVLVAGDKLIAETGSLFKAGSVFNNENIV